MFFFLWLGLGVPLLWPHLPNPLDEPAHLPAWVPPLWNDKRVWTFAPSCLVLSPPAKSSFPPSFTKCSCDLDPGGWPHSELVGENWDPRDLVLAPLLPEWPGVKHFRYLCLDFLLTEGGGWIKWIISRVPFSCNTDFISEDYHQCYTTLRSLQWYTRIWQHGISLPGITHQPVSL